MYGWGWEGGIAAVAKSEASSRRSGGGVELVQDLIGEVVNSTLERPSVINPAEVNMFGEP